MSKICDWRLKPWAKSPAHLTWRRLVWSSCGALSELPYRGFLGQALSARSARYSCRVVMAFTSHVGARAALRVS